MNRDPAFIERQRAAGRASGEKRRRLKKPEEKSEVPVTPGRPEAEIQEKLAASDRAHHDPDVASQMAVYDATVGTPQSWPDLQTRAKVLRETVTACLARDTRRQVAGAVVTKETMNAKLINLRDYIFQFLERAGHDVSEELTEHIPVKLRERIIATVDKKIQTAFHKAIANAQRPKA